MSGLDLIFLESQIEFRLVGSFHVFTADVVPVVVVCFLRYDSYRQTFASDVGYVWIL
jgi:hypothetical protein